MKINKGFIVLIAASFVLISTCLIFAQGQPQQQPVQQETAAQQAAEPEVQWLWGEVTNLDPQNKMVLVKYLDYETDQEKEATISVDEKTTYENIKSIEELKQNDPVSVDYIITPDGKNIARNISLEKPEENVMIPEESLKELNPPGSSEEAPQQ